MSLNWWYQLSKNLIIWQLSKGPPELVLVLPLEGTYTIRTRFCHLKWLCIYNCYYTNLCPSAISWNMVNNDAKLFSSKHLVCLETFHLSFFVLCANYAHSWTRRLTVTHALVTLDYCNTGYIDLSFKSIWKLQQVQNAMVWAVMGDSGSAHVSLLLCELH